MRVRDRRLGDELQVVIPEELRGEIVRANHIGAGHAAVMRTYQRIRAKCYWPGMYKDVETYVKYCPQCALKTEVRTRTPMGKHIEGEAPGMVWVVDLLHVPECGGYEYILVCVDAFSRWVELIPLKERKAVDAAKGLVEAVVTKTGGRIRTLISDAGSEFKGEVTQLCEALAIEQRYTAAHRAASHGLVERFNRTVKDRLKSMTGSDKMWVDKLPWVQLALNTAVTASLSKGMEGITPAEVHLGRRLETAWDPQYVGRMTDRAKAPYMYAKQTAEEMKEVQEYVQMQRKLYNKAMEKRFNSSFKVKERKFEQGDTVWVRKGEGGGALERKLEWPNEGPFEVVSKDGDHEYTVQKIGEGVRTRVRVHVDRMGPYRELAELAAWRRLTAADREEKSPSEGKNWEVEKIVGDRGARANKNKEYRIKWQGFSETENTWEPLVNLRHCARAVEEYELSKVGVHKVEEASLQERWGRLWEEMAKEGDAQEIWLEALQLLDRTAMEWEFKPEDAIEAVLRKVEFRTPHVFREERGVSMAQAAELWKKAKLVRKIHVKEVQGRYGSLAEATEALKQHYWKRTLQECPMRTWSVKAAIEGTGAEVKELQEELERGHREGIMDECGDAVYGFWCYKVQREEEWQTWKAERAYYTRRQDKGLEKMRKAGGVFQVGGDQQKWWVKQVKCDVSQLPEMGREALKELCEKAGIEVEEVKFVWASVPCETYSPANWSNFTRGNHHREKEKGHPPRREGGKQCTKLAQLALI